MKHPTQTPWQQLKQLLAERDAAHQAGADITEMELQISQVRSQMDAPTKGKGFDRRQVASEARDQGNTLHRRHRVTRAKVRAAIAQVQGV